MTPSPPTPSHADNKGTTYTYTADGQLATRVWARGITTGYTYDNAGRQLTVDYSDTTPDITYTYDWMGNPATVADATGTRTFTYDYATSRHPGLVSLTIPSIVNHNISYTYDAYGRKTGMSLKNGSTAIFANSYGYSNATGRLTSVGDGTYTAHYTWQDGIGLMTQNQIKRDSDSAVITTRNRTYDTRLNNYHLLSVSNTTGATTRAYSYVYNDKDQRTKLTLADGTYWEYTYDDKGQVISGIKKDAAGNAIAGQNFGYEYDGIGNRKWYTRGLTEMKMGYTSNSINQYTQIDTPGVVPVIGEADVEAAVKALRTDEVPVTSGQQSIVTVRSGKYFSGGFTDIDNTTGPVTVDYNVYAIKQDTANNKELIRKEVKQYTIPKRAQALTYDTDGNMLTNGDWSYTWNGENRMIQAVKTDDTKIEFKYDFMGRRFEKKKYSWNSSAWQLDNTEKYVWNGYNIIAIYNASDVLQKTMLYGLDINGGLQTAGGVGGLVLVNDAVTSKTYLPVYDGNGNVRVYLDSSEGSSVAEYDYKPDSDFTIKTGPKADELASIASFSTMPYDEYIDAFFWPIRIAQKGRWLSRDPSGEDGGINLYGFCKNDSINKWDYLGLIVYFSRVPADPEDAFYLISKQKIFFLNKVGNINVEVPSLDSLKLLDYNEIIKMYKTIQTAMKKRNQVQKEFNKNESYKSLVKLVRKISNSNDRFILTTGYGWIDMQHVIMGAAIYMASGSETKSLDMMTGEEVLQGIYGRSLGARASSFSYDDFPSNKLGVDFGKHISKQSMDEKSLSEKLRKFLLNKAKGFIKDPLSCPAIKKWTEELNKGKKVHNYTPILIPQEVRKQIPEENIIKK